MNCLPMSAAIKFAPKPIPEIMITPSQIETAYREFIAPLEPVRAAFRRGHDRPEDDGFDTTPYRGSQMRSNSRRDVKVDGKTLENRKAFWEKKIGKLRSAGEKLLLQFIHEKAREFDITISGSWNRYYNGGYGRLKIRRINSRIIFVKEAK